MQKGNDGNALQALEEQRAVGAYSKNHELIALAQSEDSEIAMRATEELVILNSGLVRSVALRFRDRGEDFEDLIQIGTIGLIRRCEALILRGERCFQLMRFP